MLNSSLSSLGGSYSTILTPGHPVWNIYARTMGDRCSLVLYKWH